MHITCAKSDKIPQITDNTKVINSSLTSKNALIQINVSAYSESNKREYTQNILYNLQPIQFLG